MGTKFDICSRALNRAHLKAIAAFDASTEGQVAGREYEPRVRFLMQDYPWRFATDLVDLGRLTAPPPAEWTYAFQLPGSPPTLRVMRVLDSAERPVEYQRYGDLIYTHADEAVAELVFRREEATWPAHFEEHVVADLAVLFATAIQHDLEMANALEKASLGIRARARTSDAQQQTPRRFLPGRLVTGRRG